MKFLKLSVLLLWSMCCVGMENLYERKVFISQTPYCLFLRVARETAAESELEPLSGLAINTLRIQSDTTSDKIRFYFDVTLKNTAKTIRLRGPLIPNFETASSFSLDGREYTASAIPELWQNK